jgi:hypothetical protein
LGCEQEQEQEQDMKQVVLMCNSHRAGQRSPELSKAGVAKAQMYHSHFPTTTFRGVILHGLTAQATFEVVRNNITCLEEPMIFPPYDGDITTSMKLTWAHRPDGDTRSLLRTWIENSDEVDREEATTACRALTEVVLDPALLTLGEDDSALVITDMFMIEVYLYDLTKTFANKFHAGEGVVLKEAPMGSSTRWQVRSHIRPHLS